ncbi:MAG: LiaF domain-containing protein [bacterium]
MIRYLNFLVVLSFVFLLGPTSLLAQHRDVEQFKERYHTPSGKVFHVKVDIDAAEVKIAKCPQEDEAWLTVYYTEDEFKVHEDFDEERSRLEIEFDKKGWMDSDNDGLEASFELKLPYGVDIDLAANIKAGEVEIDLGGLAMVDFDLKTWAGEVRVEFSEPNKTEMEYLDINTKVGETELIKLGNARFKDAEINGGIGEMTIDFTGELLPEARASVDLDIGETNIILPEDVGVRLSVSKFLFMSEVNLPYRFKKSGRHYYSKNYDEAASKFALKVSPGLGELKID